MYVRGGGDGGIEHLDLYAALGLYGFCAVAVCYGFTAAGGKAKREQGGNCSGKYFVFIDILYNIC